MKYCYECGTKLVLKECYNCKEFEGMIPYCEKCKEYRFPMFNIAVSMVVFNKECSKILLIKQYHRDANILVAGYVSKGENLGEALKRELHEEVKLTLHDYKFNDSKYFEKSNSLLCNFIVRVEDENFSLNSEVDSAHWFDIKTAKEEVLHNSLASYFLDLAVDKMKSKHLLKA